MRIKARRMNCIRHLIHIHICLYSQHSVFNLSGMESSSRAVVVVLARVSLVARVRVKPSDCNPYCTSSSLLNVWVSMAHTYMIEKRTLQVVIWRYSKSGYPYTLTNCFPNPNSKRSLPQNPPSTVEGKLIIEQYFK